ncbi:MAG: riboflavin biosynthesis protein RibF [Pseudomonadota bacterium]|jgi:riboflavin kinase/FMN adenylyltransferase
MGGSGDSLTPALALRRAPLMRYPRVAPDNLRGGAVTIGNFDGVHRGHERVLARLNEVANGGPAVVVSLYPHPLRVLRPASQLRYISSVREKAERCGELGVDLIYFIHFSRKIAEWSATQFVEQVLVRSLGARALVVGEDVAVGRGREGNIEFLGQTLPRYGIALDVVPRLDLNGVKAGSRAIRESITAGSVREAANIIGAPFTISARVGHGDKRGSKLGFPTANIAVGSRLIPRRGVYACLVEVDGRSYGAVANIGTRPTFNGVGERLEVHILDFEPRSLYGVRIHVGFIERLRDERRFESLDDLTAQIKADITAARGVLGDV